MAKIITDQYALEFQYPLFENMTDEEFYHFCGQNKHIPINGTKTTKYFLCCL